MNKKIREISKPIIIITFILLVINMVGFYIQSYPVVYLPVLGMIIMAFMELLIINKFER